ncbi:MAG TPA: HupE/UreJ family protein [Polyangia bacterium]|jgi:hydrogenase/urease accessory protein HupE|nr:HupE/UreJ family protein [Polyangia bacterium]
MRTSRTSRSRAFVVVPIVLAAALAPAHAHDPFEITTDAHVNGDRLGLHTTMSLLTAARVCFTGAGARKTIAVPELSALWPALDDCARRFYRVTSGGAALPVLDAHLDVTVENDLDIRLSYPRPARSPLVFEAVTLQRLAGRAMAGVVLTATGARTFLGQKVLRPDDTVFEVPITAEAEVAGTPPLPGFRAYARLGVEHILTGADHLLFLLGLLVVCRRFRTVAGIVTCFTVAHSITLALAALNVVTLGSRVVEPLIAATIVAVGVENLVRGDEPRGRWLLALAFGLVHGLGFATALKETGLGAAGASIVGPLVAFNLGVEIGQLAVAAPLLLLLWKLRGLPRFARHGARAISLIVAAVGLAWLLQRLVR